MTTHAMGQRHLLLALLQPSLLHQADELLAVLIVHHSVAAVGDQLHHALVTQHRCVGQLIPKFEFKGVLVHAFHHLQQLHLPKPQLSAY